MTDGRLEKSVERNQLDTRISADGRDPDNACVVALMWQYQTPEAQWYSITKGRSAPKRKSGRTPTKGFDTIV